MQLNFLRLVRTPLVACLGLAVAASAGAFGVTAITDDNQLIIYGTDDRFGVGNITHRQPIAGLAAGEQLVAIDRARSTGQLFGVSNLNTIYNIRELFHTGSRVEVFAQLSRPVIDDALGWGMDFDLATDIYGSAFRPSFRLVGSGGQAYDVDVRSGVVGDTVGSIPVGVAAAAFTRSSPDTVYYIDSETDTLVKAEGSLASPTITTVGSLGIDVSTVNGFEIGLPSGPGAFAALKLEGQTLDGTGVYSIDLESGAASLAFSAEDNIVGLSMAPIPELETWALMSIGLGFVGWKARRAGRQVGYAVCSASASGRAA